MSHARISDNYQVNQLKLAGIVHSYNEHNCVKFQVSELISRI